MPSAERILWLVVNAISQVFSFAKLQYVWNYLSNKPLGMQTILDSTMKVLIIAYVANMLSLWLIILKFTSYYEDIVANLCIKVYYFTSVWLNLWAIVLHMTRYFVIFHNHLIEVFDDKNYLKVSGKNQKMSKLKLNNVPILSTFIVCQNHCNRDHHHINSV